jgi:hypothetical protein
MKRAEDVTPNEKSKEDLEDTRRRQDREMKRGIDDRTMKSIVRLKLRIKSFPFNSCL